MEGKSRNLQLQPNLGEIESSKPNLKMKKQLSQTLTIPDDLIFEQILPRFPVKSIIRFKSVCKDWCNFISSSQFAKSHLKFSSASPIFLIKKVYFEKYGHFGEFYLLPYDEHNKNLKEVVQLDIQFTNSKLNPEFVGCCNGLVCLYFIDYLPFVDYFILWNPATRVYRRISTPSRGILCKCGFGYAFALDNYKIVAAFCLLGGDETSTQIWVYSLRVGKWKQIDLSSDDGADVDLFICWGDVNGVFVKNCLYWSVWRLGIPSQHQIVSFSLLGEQFKLIATPASEFIDCTPMVIKGCLSLHCYPHQRDWSSDIWILKQQGGCNSWEKLFSIPSTSFSAFKHLAFSPTGKCLVEHLRQLKLVDLTLEDLEDAQGIDFDSLVYSVFQYVESLISPISPFGTV